MAPRISPLLKTPETSFAVPTRNSSASATSALTPSASLISPKKNSAHSSVTKPMELRMGRGGKGGVKSSGCSFALPHGLVFSEDENYVFVADTNNNCVRCLDMQKQICVTVAGMEHRKGTLGGSLEKMLISEPRGIAINSSGHLVVSSRSAIYNIDLDSNKATIIAGSEATGFKDGKLEDSLFDHPDGLVCINNLIFVADTYNHRIRVISLEADECSVSTYAVHWLGM
eukprot:TRINITY_DN10795_c0_g1_i1.p1 TRINITY_DN10795_c0_g1~~TRINITY_DN10795_c0_g1_i1.p1  ORF type:complete len:228 (+),score=31.11 TRINITY_DN10795_c0_g1_i1:256-939(+)